MLQADSSGWDKDVAVKREQRQQQIQKRTRGNSSRPQASMAIDEASGKPYFTMPAHTHSLLSVLSAVQLSTAVTMQLFSCSLLVRGQVKHAE